MMIDVLAWKEGGGTDIRRPAQRDAVKKICKAVRNDDAVWGYNLWNESLSYFGNPDGKDIDTYIRLDGVSLLWYGGCSCAKPPIRFRNCVHRCPG